MTHLCEMASVPILTDVMLDIEGVDDCELYPFPIQDLFCGAPLTISGQYGGKYFPASITLTGRLADGSEYSTLVPTTPAGSMPVCMRIRSHA